MARRRAGVCLKGGEKYDGGQLFACPMFRNLGLLRTSELYFVILKLKGGILLTIECCYVKFPLQSQEFYSVELSKSMAISGKKISICKKMIVTDFKMFNS
jgi:hypothetical protein